MQAGDYGDERSEPWTYRQRIIPLRTYSGRVVYRRRRHTFSMDDVSRILAKIQPPEISDGRPEWIVQLIGKLRDATLFMLGQLLPFLEERSIGAIYDFGIQVIDQALGIQTGGPGESQAIDLIYQLADRAGYVVTLERKKV